MLSVVILSLNRLDSLRRTLRELTAMLAAGIGVDAEILVADNASTDGTPIMVESEFPDVRLLPQVGNIAIEAFNRAAAQARGDLLLILDDDAWPDPESLRRAVSMMLDRPRLGGIALSPVHPRTGLAEWRFLRASSDLCPVMGCGNLVRTRAWNDVGGYDSAFFLYRNDTDLAMKLLAAGWAVHADPGWVVWHDSPHAARKSDRWLHLATRNWCWVARRHGRGVTKLAGLLMGSAWALRQAGFSMSRIAKVLRGVREGAFGRCPRLPDGLRPNGRAFASLLNLQLSNRRQPSPRPLPLPASVRQQTHVATEATTASSIARHSP